MDLAEKPRKSKEKRSKQIKVNDTKIKVFQRNLRADAGRYTSGLPEKDYINVNENKANQIKN